MGVLERLGFSLNQAYELGKGIHIIEFEDWNFHSSNIRSLDGESDLQKLRVGKWVYHRGLRFSLIQAYVLGEGIQIVEVESRVSYSTKLSSLERKYGLHNSRVRTLTQPSV